MSTRLRIVRYSVAEYGIPGYGSRPPMLPLWSRKVSGLFRPLLTTSTLFVATHSAGSTNINRLYRTAVAEDGLATTHPEIAGVTHSKRGKRY